MPAFDHIEPGATASIRRRFEREDVEAFATLSGDRNPLHLDEQFASETALQRPVVHGMLVASMVSTLVGMHLPGKGALWMQQEFRWPAPVFAGDTVEATLTVVRKSPGTQTVVIEVKAMNQDHQLIMEGSGTVMMPEHQQRRGEPPLSERVAFVTGGSGSIGKAIALGLGKAGASVAVHYCRNEKSAEETCEEITRLGGKAFTVHADFQNHSQAAAAVESSASQFGRPIDLLVNNAVQPFTPQAFLDCPLTEFARQFELQVMAAAAMCCAVLPGMIRSRSGCIINIGSAFTHGMPPPQWSAYVAAKYALAGFTKSLAVEYGRDGVRVNMISPGMANTPSLSQVPERLKKVQAMQSPLRRLADPEDVAAAVLFLCSEASRHLTGVDLPVCGGCAS